MKVLESRLLRGPNLYALQPCCAVLLAVDESDAVDGASWPDFATRLGASIADLREAAADRPRSPGWVVGQVALALQRRAGVDVDFVVEVPSTTAPGEVRVAFAYGPETIAEPSLHAAVELVAAARAGVPFDPTAKEAELRRRIDEFGVDASTAALLDAARQQDIPVLRLADDARTFQLGWGSRQRRVEGRAPAFGRTAPQPALETLFAPGDDGRIPTVAITGTNGKTTTTLLIAHVVRGTGARTGTTTTSGIFIDGRIVERGDCTGYWSARKVLTSDEVDVATLETARGGLLKRGLAFDRCDVGVVLNVASDHLGLDGIETLSDLAWAKGLVARCAADAAVLNAEDPHCVAMRATLRRGCEPVFFSMDPKHPVLRAHLASGGRAAVLDDGALTWCEPGARRRMIAPERLPFTLHGHARYNVANALAALAALVCMGYADDAITAGFESFVSDARQNPLRTNRLDVAGTTLIVDYAHNVVAYRALCEMARSLLAGKTGRLLGVVTSPGDRRATDLYDVGRVCGAFFDELFVYEQDPRGRAPGQTVEAILAGSRSAAGDKPLHGIPSIREALASGLAASRPGDVLVFTCAGTLEDLVDAVRRAHPSSAPSIAEAVGLPASVGARTEDSAAVAAG